MSVKAIKVAAESPRSAKALTRPPEVRPSRYPRMLSDPGSIEAESIRALRTRFVAQHVQEGRRSVAVCSPSAGSGCTFVATNLAVSLAQIGIPTILVDSDLREGGATRSLKLPPDLPGLSDYLSDPSLELGEVLLDEVLPDLAILPAGRLAPNPQELLSGSRFPALVDQLLRTFSITIFDTTPANRCTDAQRVANVASYSLIVARKHQSFLNDVKTLAQQLKADHSVVIGTVLNDY